MSIIPKYKFKGTWDNHRCLISAGIDEYGDYRKRFIAFDEFDKLLTNQYPHIARSGRHLPYRELYGMSATVLITFISNDSRKFDSTSYAEDFQKIINIRSIEFV